MLISITIIIFPRNYMYILNIPKLWQVKPIPFFFFFCAKL